MAASDPAISTGMEAAPLAFLGLGSGRPAFGLGVRTWEFGFRPIVRDWQLDLRPMRVGVESWPMPYYVCHGSSAFVLEVSARLVGLRPGRSGANRHPCV